ncbi:MAG: oligosaccharide flippase family protein [Xanthomonadaceae bacterium]|nr:oligosaccharide flippase family protein [Xanthomonadaceae bacterium]
MAFTFLLGWQLARGLGAAGYGIYGVAMAVVSILGVPSQFGLPQLLTREVASANATADRARLSGVIRWSTRIAIVSSLVILLLVVGWTVCRERGVTSPLGASLAVGALLVPLVALGAMTAAVLRGLLAVVIAQVPDNLVRPAVHSLLLGVLLIAGVAMTPVTAMSAGVVGALVALLTGVALVWRRLPTGWVHVPPTEFHSQWLAAAFPMALTEGLRVVQGQAAILALGALVVMTEVGQFRVAASLMTLLAFPLSVFNLVAAPHVSTLAATGDHDRLRRMLAHVASGMTVSVLILVLPFAIAGRWLIATVFGSEFGDSNPIVLVLALGVLANAAFGVGATALNMLGHPQRVTRASVWSVAMLCLLLWPCIAILGAVGAAGAVSAAMALWSFLLWRDTKRLAGMDIGVWAWQQATQGKQAR